MPNSPTPEIRGDGEPTGIDDIDLTRSELYRHGFPHGTFAFLRREAPVWWHPLPPNFSGNDDAGVWVLSRYDDIQAANRDSQLFSAFEGPALGHNPEMHGAMLVSMDGREHTRQRRIISAGFTPRMVGRLEERARRWSESIVGEALERGRCDFVYDVAYRLPMHMIADIMGIPLEDRDWLFQVTNDFLLASDSENVLTREDQVAKQVEMFQYAQELGQRKRKDPGDDIWTILSAAAVDTGESDQSTLSEMELNLFFLLLTVAGSETTRNAITLGLVALLDHPDQLEDLRNGKAEMKAAVEEIIRWSSPVGYFCRRATRDTEIRGVRIAAGERISLWYASGNRDEDVFADPFRFDIRRSPNHHVAFGGGGPHFCLGANLARFEIAILFEELLRRARAIEVLEPLSYSVLGIYNPILLAPKALPIRLA